MSLFQALILGIVQGLTEFLPISSSAHLVLLPYWLGWQIPEAQIFPFGVLVQMGTLAAVIAYFWKDLWGIAASFLRCLVKREPFGEFDSRLGWYLILATVPAGLLGMLVKDQVEQAFQSPLATAGFLFVTAALLVVSEQLGKRSRTMKDLNWVDALWMGAAQALAIFPGVSRSGSTIAGGLARQLKRTVAARFSFLMSIPVMLAAGLLSTLDLLEAGGLADMLLPVAVGFASAAVVGYLSIRWLLAFITRHSLKWFAVYCVVVASLTLLVGFIRG